MIGQVVIGTGPHRGRRLRAELEGGAAVEVAAAPVLLPEVEGLGEALADLVALLVDDAPEARLLDARDVLRLDVGPAGARVGEVVQRALEVRRGGGGVAAAVEAAAALAGRGVGRLRGG